MRYVPHLCWLARFDIEIAQKGKEKKSNKLKAKEGIEKIIE